jgi:hypothetical protein
MSLATRWPWVSAVILLKPTLLPFAIVGIRDRRWWAVVVGLLVISLVMWPLMLEWTRTMMNATGPLASLFYSLENVPAMLVPVVAWLGSTRQPPALLARLEQTQQHRSGT